MKRTAIAFVVVIMFAGGAAAQEQAGSLTSRGGYVSIGIAGGMLIDPDMAGGAFSLDYYVTDEISVGPYFVGGGYEDNSFWGVSGQVKFSAPLAGNASVRPYGQLGIGFVELDFEDREDDPEMTYFFPLAGGFEFELTDILSLDVGGQFHVTEDTFAGAMVGLRVLL